MSPAAGPASALAAAHWWITSGVSALALLAGGAGASAAAVAPLARSMATATGLATLAYALPLARLALARLQVMLDMGVGDGRGAESPTALGRALLTTLYLAREVSEAQRRAVVLLLSYTPLGYLVLQRN